MKIWLRINGLEFSSWYIVHKELAGAFREYGVEVHNDMSSYPLGVNEYIEMWWCDPEYWDWSDKKVRLRVGIALSEHRSLFATNPKTVIRNINQCDVLFCPSYSAMQAYLESPIEVPIYLMPLGVNPCEFHYCERNFDEMPFKFLHLGVTQFRKGSWLACEAFIKAFGKDDDAQLTIATHRPSPMYEQLQKEYGHRISFVCNKVISSLEYYKQHHVLVAPHLSEGFGLCIPEAMATGMPCIVSRCSAPREYFDKKYGWWIEMSELYSPVNQCFPGVRGLWRLPDVNSIAERIRYVFENRQECKEKGEQASEYVLANMTWKNSVLQAISTMEKLL